MNTNQISDEQINAEIASVFGNDQSGAVKALIAIKAILAISPPVEGWKLVPIEPTKEMLAVDIETNEFIGIDDARNLYRAMLSVAPTAPNNQEVKPNPESVSRDRSEG